MSSPFSSLRKNKVPLFPGHMSGNRPIPFRHPDYTEDESRLLEEITTSMALERRKQSEQLLPPLPIGNCTPRHGDDSSNSCVPSMLRRFGPGIKPQAADSGVQAESSEEAAVTSPPSDKELMRLMMNRIAVLEQTNQTQSEQLRVKDRQIKVLEDRLRIAEKARREAGSSSAMKELETHCLLLQQQVHEMETFLAEYGMVWVGENPNDGSDFYIDNSLYDDQDDGVEDELDSPNPSLRRSASDTTTLTSEPSKLWRQDTSLAPGLGDGVKASSSSSSLLPKIAKTSPDIDFNRLLENIQDLNILAGAGLAQVKRTSDGARFQIPDSVPLTIYANGILMFDGPFRPYSDPSTHQCVQDLMDGYFPSELQHRYPDGVPFVVTDMRDTHYQPKVRPFVFTGEGQMLGGEQGPSRLIPTNVADQTKKVALPYVMPGGMTSSTQTAVSPSHLGKPLTQAQFLNKLPKSVIKDGKVIDVRDSIGKTLSGAGDSSGSNNVTLVSTSVTQEINDGIIESDGTKATRPRSTYRGHGDVTTLRVVAEQGQHTYILKMKFSETIGNLRTYLDSQRRQSIPYDIVSTFPHKVHKNNNLTLEQSGLTPNAVLHLKPHKQ